jgi:hypothetical protein
MTTVAGEDSVQGKFVYDICMPTFLYKQLAYINVTHKYTTTAPLPPPPPPPPRIIIINIILALVVTQFYNIRYILTQMVHCQRAIVKSTQFTIKQY